MEFLMDLIDHILLDVFSVRIRQIEQAFGKVSDDRMLMKEFLVVESLGQELLLGGGTDNGGLIGEHQLLFLNPFTGFTKEAGLSTFLHIEIKNTGIDVVRMDQIFAIMIGSCRILDLRDVLVVEKMNIAVEHDIGIKIEKSIWHILDLVSKKADQGVRRTVSSFVRAAFELALIKRGDIVDDDFVLETVRLKHLFQALDGNRGDGGIIRFDPCQSHGEDMDVIRVRSGALENGEQTGHDTIEDSVISTE